MSSVRRHYETKGVEKPKESGFIGRYICSRNDSDRYFWFYGVPTSGLYRRHGKGLDADVTYYWGINVDSLRFHLIIHKTDGIKAAQGSVFSAGMQAVVAIFGIAWMGDTFIAGNMTELKGSIEHIVTQMPWLFGLALFVMSILLFSQAATIRALLPLGIALGISPYMLIALFPAVNGYFFIPNYPTVVAAINFDRTGTTRIGKYILNHSFMMPGLIATGVSVGLGLLFIQFI